MRLVCLGHPIAGMTFRKLLVQVQAGPRRHLFGVSFGALQIS